MRIQFGLRNGDVVEPGAGLCVKLVRLFCPKKPLPGRRRSASISRLVGPLLCEQFCAMTPLSVVARENTDNLIFVINCNLQRVDGPVRGNGSIVQELENAIS